MYKNRVIRHLNSMEEREILYSILRSGVSERDQGSSRIVLLDFSDNTREVLERLNINTDCVIKINVGKAGSIQSSQERDVYESATEEEVSILADIYAYGDVVQIMEKVDESGVCQIFRDMIDDVYEESDGYTLVDDEDIDEYLDRYAEYLVDYYGDYEDLNEARYVVERAFEDFDNYIHLIYNLTGYTSDNAQVGYNACGNLKAYDYGYFDTSENSECCFSGDTYSIKVEKYLSSVVNLDEVNAAELEKIALGM